MSVQITPVFSSFILQDKLKVDNERLKKFCYDVRGKDSGRAISNAGGWQSNDLPFDDPILGELLVEILLKIEAATSVLGLKETVRHGISTVWININKKHNYNLTHAHGLAFLSGVYYVDADHDTGDIYFTNPNPKIESTYAYVNEKINTHVVDKYNQFNRQKWGASPETGKLIVFPGYLDHYVHANKTDKDRISISFNTALVNGEVEA